jgi:hypothetical protein
MLQRVIKTARLIPVLALVTGCHLIYPFNTGEATDAALDAPAVRDGSGDAGPDARRDTLIDAPWVPTDSDADTGTGNDAAGDATTDVTVTPDAAPTPQTGFCNAATGWCWLKPLPQGNNLVGVWAYGGSKAFAVGWGSTIMHYDGKTWSRQLSGLSYMAKLHAVWGHSSTNVFAVGENEKSAGVVLRYNGTSWKPMTIPSSERIRAVWGTSASNVYAAAEGGHLLKYNGSSWVTAHKSVTNLYSLAIWATAGYVYAGWGAEILHWNTTSSSWDKKALGGACGTVNSIYGSSASNVYALCSKGTVYRYNGSLWSLDTTLSTSTMRGLGSSGGGHIYAVGDKGVIQHRAPTGTWTPETTPTTNGLLAISSNGPNSIFAVGMGGVLLWNGGSAWTEQSTGTSRGQIFAFSGPSSTDLAAVDGEAKVWLFDGSSWSFKSQVVTPAKQLYALWGSSTSDLFAGGQGWNIYRSSSGGWLPSNNGAGTNWDHVEALWGRSGTDLYATGTGGVVKNFNGSTWNKFHEVTGKRLYALWGDATELFAAGEGNEIHHYNGSTWSTKSLPLPSTIKALWGINAKEVYAVGTSDVIVRYNGVKWTKMQVPSSLNNIGLASVCGFSASNIFVGGIHGTLLHHSGGSWKVVHHDLTAEVLQAMWCGPAPGGGSAVFIGGPNGMVLYRAL